MAITSKVTGAFLDGGRFLANIFTKDANTGNFFKKILDGINNVAKAAGVAPVGDVEPPPPIASINVKVAGEILHATANHPGVLNKGVKTVWQVDTNPSFSQPHIITTESRTLITTLPTNDDNGHPVSYYVRAIPQYQGSQPQQPTNFGTTKPTPIVMAGTTNMTLLPSTGAGTASNNGQQGLHGLGKVLTRPATSVAPTSG
jgi:hypothetical protein